MMKTVIHHPQPTWLSITLGLEAFVVSCNFTVIDID